MSGAVSAAIAGAPAAARPGSVRVRGPRHHPVRGRARRADRAPRSARRGLGGPAPRGTRRPVRAADHVVGREQRMVTPPAVLEQLPALDQTDGDVEPAADGRWPRRRRGRRPAPAGAAHAGASRRDRGWRAGRWRRSRRRTPRRRSPVAVGSCSMSSSGYRTKGWAAKRSRCPAEEVVRDVGERVARPPGEAPAARSRSYRPSRRRSRGCAVWRSPAAAATAARAIVLKYRATAQRW